jgi:hypothetical protein
MLDDGMLMVRLLSDPSMEIPSFEEDLLRDEDAEPVLAGAKFVQGRADKKPDAPPRREIKSQYLILKPKGLQLAFEPMPGKDGMVSRYKAWLVNDTSQEFLIEFDLFTSTRDVLQVDDKSTASTALELGDILYDDLNDAPEVILTIRRITTEGMDEPLEKRMKMKAKSFFNSLQTVPILNLPAHNYLLFDHFEQEQKDESNDLQAYTKQKVSRPGKDHLRNSVPFHAHNVEEFASFLPEIDLHIENLLNGHARLDKGEILRIQMLHFQRFLDKAIQLGVPRVFIIHGVGEGKLKEAITQRLRANPDVLKYKNEFHHKYGYGATEVILMME